MDIKMFLVYLLLTGVFADIVGPKMSPKKLRDKPSLKRHTVLGNLFRRITMNEFLVFFATMGLFAQEDRIFRVPRRFAYMVVSMHSIAKMRHAREKNN